MLSQRWNKIVKATGKEDKISPLNFISGTVPKNPGWVVTLYEGTVWYSHQLYMA